MHFFLKLHSLDFSISPPFFSPVRRWFPSLLIPRCSAFFFLASTWQKEAAGIAMRAYAHVRYRYNPRIINEKRSPVPKWSVFVFIELPFIYSRRWLAMGLFLTNHNLSGSCSALPRISHPNLIMSRKYHRHLPVAMTWHAIQCSLDATLMSL